RPSSWRPLSFEHSPKPRRQIGWRPHETAPRTSVHVRCARHGTYACSLGASESRTRKGARGRKAGSGYRHRPPGDPGTCGRGQYAGRERRARSPGRIQTRPVPRTGVHRSLVRKIALENIAQVDRPEALQYLERVTEKDFQPDSSATVWPAVRIAL